MTMTNLMGKLWQKIVTNRLTDRGMDNKGKTVYTPVWSMKWGIQTKSPFYKTKVVEKQNINIPQRTLRNLITYGRLQERGT